jgi:hypothetical protein
MRKVLASLALGCAFAVALSVAASACEYMKSVSAQTANQTAQAQPAAAQANN